MAILSQPISVHFGTLATIPLLMPDLEHTGLIPIWRENGFTTQKTKIHIFDDNVGFNS
jgi:hypothetical protein